MHPVGGGTVARWPRRPARDLSDIGKVLAKVRRFEIPPGPANGATVRWQARRGSAAHRQMRLPGGRRVACGERARPAVHRRIGDAEGGRAAVMRGFAAPRAASNELTPPISVRGFQIRLRASPGVPSRVSGRLRRGWPRLRVSGNRPARYPCVESGWSEHVRQCASSSASARRGAPSRGRAFAGPCCPPSAPQPRRRHCRHARM